MEKRPLYRTRSLLLVIALSFLLALAMGAAAARAQGTAGGPVVIKYWNPNYPPELEITRILSKDLDKLGIKMEIKSSGYDLWVSDIVRGENPFDLVLCTWGSSPARFDPNFFLSEIFLSDRSKPGGKNYGYNINDEYDRLILAQQEEMERKK
ncbi:MAG: hypothetical protein JRH07_19310, partial [Deltaproteobacteria bacterium]|nr:hypothetical protein [Deltaproteobacteria bacterium]